MSTKAQIAERTVVVSRMLAEGRSWSYIARQLGISKAAVSRMAKPFDAEEGDVTEVKPGKRCGRCYLLEPHVCLPKCDASAQRRSP